MPIPMPHLGGRHVAAQTTTTTGADALAQAMEVTTTVTDAVGALLGRTALVSVGVDGVATLAAHDLADLVVLASRAPR